MASNKDSLKNIFKGVSKGDNLTRRLKSLILFKILNISLLALKSLLLNNNNNNKNNIKALLLFIRVIKNLINIK